MKRMILTIIGGLLVTGVLVWGQDGIAQNASKGPGSAMAMMDEDQGPFRRGMRMGRGGPGGPGGDIPPELAEKIELTDAQKNRMKSLNTAFAKDMAKLEADVKITQIELQEVMDQAAPSTSAVKSQAAKVNEARGEIFERSVVFRAEMKGILTAEQQATMKAEGRKMRSEHRGRGMRGRRGMRGQGPGFMQRGGGDTGSDP
jgi:Spy/CpxP family protein refolding chaperone